MSVDVWAGGISGSSVTGPAPSDRSEGGYCRQYASFGQYESRQQGCCRLDAPGGLPLSSTASAETVDTLSLRPLSTTRAESAVPVRPARRSSRASAMRAQEARSRSVTLEQRDIVSTATAADVGFTRRP